ncbi:MAG: hypothetical protein ACK5NG_04420, partial [Chthoniobacterales bacterium]
KIQAHLFDDEGKLVTSQDYTAEGLAACGVRVQNSGVYYLKILGNFPESVKTVPFAVVYSFK